jgi:hypothetical protein
MILLSYTFSKLISDTETFTNWLEGGSVAGVQDYNNLRLEKSLSSFDSRQRLTLSFVYDLPFGKGNRFASNASGLTNRLISGWGFNGLLTFQEGFPLGMTATPNQLSQYDTGLRPNVIGGCAKEIDGPIQQRLNRHFNTSCFTVPAPFTFGNESRTDPDLRGHGTNNVDFAMFKKTPITENTNLEFRVESFNLFNRVKFANPNLTANTAANNTFGVISSQANTPRLLQLALRLSF